MKELRITVRGRRESVNYLIAFEFCMIRPHAPPAGRLDNTGWEAAALRAHRVMHIQGKRKAVASFRRSSGAVCGNHN